MITSGLTDEKILSLPKKELDNLNRMVEALIAQKKNLDDLIYEKNDILRRRSVLDEQQVAIERITTLLDRCKRDAIGQIRAGRSIDAIERDLVLELEEEEEYPYDGQIVDEIPAVIGENYEILRQYEDKLEKEHIQRETGVALTQAQQRVQEIAERYSGNREAVNGPTWEFNSDALEITLTDILGEMGDSESRFKTLIDSMKRL